MQETLSWTKRPRRPKPYAERRASTLGPLFLSCGIHMALRHSSKRENRKNTRK
nr:MAG TPA: hypothetical protein [Caudoviricetes sp.]